MSIPLQFIIPKLANNESSEGTKIVLTIQMNKPTIADTTQQLRDQLYKRVVAGDYEAAVTKTLRLEQEGNSQVIIDTVNKLLNDGKKNILEFAYKLWNMFGKDIVIDCFPPEFRMLLNEESVIFVSKKYNVPITLNSITDEKNETLAIAYTPDRKLECVLKTIWEDKRVYFKIFSSSRHQYLKLKNFTYTDGNFACIGAEYNTYNQQWYLHPFMNEGDLLFYITNREYNQVLKFSDNLDKDNCRYLYGYKNEYKNNPDVFEWYIKPF